MWQLLDFFMCWSFGASAVFAIIGIVFTIYLAHKKESKFLWVPLGYFALMEALQAITYPYLGNCGSSANQLLTLLSYIHITFQPIFVNAFVLYFIPTRVRKKIIWPVLSIAVFFTFILILKLVPLAWAGSCMGGTAMCGEEICSYMGSWHLAWSIPFNGFGGLSMMTYYLIATLVLPLVYGSWKTTLGGIATGPIFTILLTNNPDEWPAIWCLFSVAIILIAIITPLRNWLHVKKWYFWDYP